MLVQLLEAFEREIYRRVDSMLRAYTFEPNIYFLEPDSSKIQVSRRVGSLDLVEISLRELKYVWGNFLPCYLTGSYRKDSTPYSESLRSYTLAVSFKIRDDFLRDLEELLRSLDVLTLEIPQAKERLASYSGAYLHQGSFRFNYPSAKLLNFRELGSSQGSSLLRMTLREILELGTRHVRLSEEYLLSLSEPQNLSRSEKVYRFLEPGELSPRIGGVPLTELLEEGKVLVPDSRTRYLEREPKSYLVYFDGSTPWRVFLEVYGPS